MLVHAVFFSTSLLLLLPLCLHGTLPYFILYAPPTTTASSQPTSTVHHRALSSIVQPALTTTTFIDSLVSLFPLSTYYLRLCFLYHRPFSTTISHNPTSP
ncbi:hypothetical protein DFP72DRAFT_271273 [Ephemerocybe angulata]|uniref:Secreted protein n=1 Tax=Ephemerocybe angulata TaxID=980116 RepID=A0A8H6M907_9AGAR|nr:hypothetical protein DFP72DRAFT_271273 [Tulosesus angulatus]